MSNYSNKPNYGESRKNNTEYYDHEASYATQGETFYAPQNYTSQHDIYREDSAGKDFLLGAIVGGIIGAATALLLAPKTGTELRGTISEQATTLKDKSSDLSQAAKTKTTDFSKKVSEQSNQLLSKVKKNQTPPMDDGTASSEGEEEIDVIGTVSNTIDESDTSDTVVGEAFSDAIAEKKEDDSNDNKLN
ncbi:YtxH domain-containing protein [Chryseomicrobium palamuruense]|uniref:YtxH domain-containing protein n=1 Tax=Chryseomicrobium palamuruense TaxID=682973 RepID=A0ABV8UYT4_9BACL